MRKVIILIGAPGSGKSTLALRLEALGFKRLNADKIREELYGDEAIQGNWKEVWGVFNKRLEDTLFFDTCNIVIDNTNIRSKDRNAIKYAVNLLGGAETETWLIDVPLEVCIERNAKRDRNTPQEIIEAMFNRLQNCKPHILEEAVLVIGTEGIDEGNLRKHLGI